MPQFPSSALILVVRLLSWGSGLLALFFVARDRWLRSRGMRRFPAIRLLYSGLTCLVIGPGVLMIEVGLLGFQLPSPIWWLFVAVITLWPGLILTTYGGWTVFREHGRSS
jgi:hypothetical protein